MPPKMIYRIKYEIRISKSERTKVEESGVEGKILVP